MTNTSSLSTSLLVRGPFTCDYHSVWQAMQRFTNTRDANTVDEIWLVEHEPVFTQGQNGQAEHVLDAGDIPIIKTDRGGQITYHGPGQLMVYTLIDLKRKALSIRSLVCALEQTVIDLLAAYHVAAYGKRDAPGVYVKNEQDQDMKLCSIGLRVRRGATYHGIALNVNMDLAPFLRINPCGFRGLKMTQLSELTSLTEINETAQLIIKYLMKNLGYTSAHYSNDLLPISL